MASRKPIRRQTLWLMVTGCILLVAAAAYIRLWLHRPIGAGPAGPTVDRGPFAEVWTDRRLVVLGVGDSITAGLGAAREETSYFNRLIRNPDDDYPDVKGLCLANVLPNLEKINLAVSGSTSLAHIDVIRERVPTYDPEVLGIVVMTTGGNDLIHNYGRTAPREGAMYGAASAEALPWVDNFRDRLSQMLDLLDARFPGGCHVFLANIYDPTDGVGDAPSVYLPTWPDGLAIHAAYNEVIQKCCEERPNVYLVDLYGAFLGHGSHCRQFWRSTYRSDDPHYWYFENIEDPNDRGYDAIRRLFLNRIARVAPLLKSRVRAAVE